MFLKIEVCSTFYSYEQIEKIVSFYMVYNMSKSKFKQSRFIKSASNHRSLSLKYKDYFIKGLFNGNIIGAVLSFNYT